MHSAVWTEQVADHQRLCSRNAVTQVDQKGDWGNFIPSPFLAPNQRGSACGCQFISPKTKQVLSQDQLCQLCLRCLACHSHRYAQHQCKHSRTRPLQCSITGRTHSVTLWPTMDWEFATLWQQTAKAVAPIIWETGTAAKRFEKHQTRHNVTQKTCA